MRTQTQGLRNVIDVPTNGSCFICNLFKPGFGMNRMMDYGEGIGSIDAWCNLDDLFTYFSTDLSHIFPLGGEPIEFLYVRVWWVFTNLSNYITFFIFILFYGSQHWSANLSCWDMKGSTICQPGGLKAVKWESNWSSCWKVTFLLLHINTVFLTIWVRHALLLDYICKSIDLSLTR